MQEVRAICPDQDRFAASPRDHSPSHQLSKLIFQITPHSRLKLPVLLAGKYSTYVQLHHSPKCHVEGGWSCMSYACITHTQAHTCTHACTHITRTKCMHTSECTFNLSKQDLPPLYTRSSSLLHFPFPHHPLSTLRGVTVQRS